MRHIAKSLQGLIFFAAIVSTPGFAADIIILREVPEHNVFDPTYTPGPAISVPADQRELVLGLVPGAKLNDDAVDAVVAPSEKRSGLRGLPTDAAQGAFDATRGDAVSNLPNSGLGSFSSLDGLGGQISDQVGSAVSNGLSALSNFNSTPGQ